MTRVTSESDQEGSTRKYLAFQVAGDTYGVPLLDVQEIRAYSSATRMPGAPHAVLGVMNLRGTIIAVVDARRRFGLPPDAEGSGGVTIVATSSGRTQALRVDSVSDVIEISPDQLQSPPLGSSQGVNEYVEAIARFDDGVVTLLRLDAVLSVGDGSEAAA